MYEVPHQTPTANCKDSSRGALLAVVWGLAWRCRRLGTGMPSGDMGQELMKLVCLSWFASVNGLSVKLFSTCSSAGCRHETPCSGPGQKSSWLLFSWYV
jgi:hypothetical protein